MKKFWLLLMAVVMPLTISASDLVSVRAEYEYVSNNPHETPDEAERIAIERAMQKALEDRFGLDVTSVTSTMVRSIVEDGDAHAQTDVFSLGGASVRGEWIETKECRVLSKEFKNGFWIVRVLVSGKARNNSVAKADVSYALLNDADDRDNRTQYRDGNDFFLRFSSPVSGSLCVYLVDEEKNAYCLLPYMSTTIGCQPIEANKDYLFFSSKADRMADEFTLNTQRFMEHNAVFIVFTPNRLIKAKDNQSGKNWRDEQMPRQLSYETFLRWLADNQKKDPEMVVITEQITIRK